MSDLIEQAERYINLVTDDRCHSDSDEIMERLIVRVKELEADVQMWHHNFIVAQKSLLETLSNLHKSQRLIKELEGNS